MVLAQTKNSGLDSFTHDAELGRIGVLPWELQTAFRSTLPCTEVIFTSTIQMTPYPHATRLLGIEKRWEHRKETVRKLGDGTEKVLHYRGVKKLGTKSRKECVVGAHGLGILGQRYD